MVVLVITSVFAGLVAPAMRSALRDTSLTTSADKVRSMIDFAYASAVSRRSRVVVDIALPVCRVRMHTIALPWRPQTDQPRVRSLAMARLPGNIDCIVSHMGGGMAGDSDRIVFDRNGRTRDARIELTDANGSAVVIEIVGATGQTRIESSS